MGRLSIANLSIAAAILIAYLLTPSRYLLPHAFFNGELLKSFGLVKASLVLTFVSYWPLAFAIYVALRLVRIERYLAAARLPQAAVAVGNALLLYSVVPGMAQPRSVGIAGWWVLCGGLAWLLAASFGARDDERPPVPLSLGESAAALLLVAAPALIALNALYGKDGVLRQAAIALARFEALCASAGERIAKPVDDVAGVFVDPTDTMTEYFHIERGVYAGTGWRGTVAGRAVASRELLFYEMKSSVAGAAPYVRYTAGALPGGQPAQELQSRHALVQRELLRPEDAKLGLKGVEISVTELATNEKLAATTYYVSTWHSRFCGNVEDDRSFAPASFVKRALRLTPR